MSDIRKQYSAQEKTKIVLVVLKGELTQNQNTARYGVHNYTASESRQQKEQRLIYGSRRMQAYLRNLGHCVNRKRIQSLYRLMGLEALYPKPNLSKAMLEHIRIYYEVLKLIVVITYGVQV